MRDIIIGIFFLCCCTQATFSLAANQNPLSMHDLIALGLETNLGLQIEVVEVEKGGEEVEIEKSAFDKIIFASTGYERFSTPYESSYTTSEKSSSELFLGQLGIRRNFMSGLSVSMSLNSEWATDNDLSNDLDSRYRTALSLDLSQPLLRNLGTSVNTTRLEISKKQHQQLSLEYLLQAQNLILQIEAAACQLAAKAQIITLHQEALSLSDELYLANKKRFVSGFIPISEVQEAETALASRQLSLSMAIQERDLLQEKLNRQLNNRLSTEFEPATLVDFEYDIKAVPIPDFEHLVESAQQKRLELKINNYAVQSSSLQQDYLRNQLKPQLDLKFQAGVNGLSGNERSSASSSRYSGGWLDSFSSLSEADGYQWRTGLEFTMPLGNRSAKSRYRQAELQLKQDKYRHKNLEAIIENDLKQQQVNISHTEEQLRITERFELLAKKSFQQEQRRLDEGLSDTFRMIFFQQKMIEAKIDRINAITRYHLALAQMEFAAGNIFERHNIVVTNKIGELNLENI